MKTIKKVTRAEKNKAKFPDRDGNGKVTKKDILIAKGVIPMKKKK
jgi:hypothetical protein